MWSASAIGAIVAEDSVDLHEISDNRLRFKEGRHGTITARFIVTEDRPWRKIRIDYRRPGENLSSVNIVRAWLMQISRISGEAEMLFGISSVRHPVDSDEIQSIEMANPGKAADFNNFYYYVEIEMRRKLFVPEEVARAREVGGVALAPTGTPALAQYARESTEAEKIPSVPIPPPSEAEIAAIESLRDLANKLQFGILTPSPELIGVALSTASTGF